MELRASVGEAAGRVRAGAWPAVQCGLGASGAWAFATHVLGHPRPFFASVAAVVALGVSGGSRLRRTAELAVGVALGVAVGDLLVQLLGQGAWQIGVVVTAALLLALAVGGTGLAVIQAGLQAVFVVALPRAPHSGLHRWQDALVGGAAALLVAAFLPTDPWREARRRQDSYVTKLAGVLRDTAEGIRSASAPAIADALARGRTLENDLVAWKQATKDGQESARLTPLRATRTQDWLAADRLATALTMSSRNLRVGIRRALTAVQQGHPLAEQITGLLDDLADAVARLGDAHPASDDLRLLARRLDPVALGATTLADQVLVGQLRVVVVDLLGALGTTTTDARAELPQLGS
ncbi:MAG TPA: FUSC family protein [Mycobacteriales bacterium]|nr:FUSC family protein [Mycobacteriales bacterium]